MVFFGLVRSPSEQEKERFIQAEAYAKIRKKTDIKSESITDEYALKKYKAQLEANKRIKSLSKQPKKTGFFQGLRKELTNISRQTQSQSSVNNNRQQVVINNSPRYNSPRENFFEHKSEQEVYGDEGLTFFDSNKPQRSNRSTGSMFGI